jgi:hypothetical protein
MADMVEKNQWLVLPFSQVRKLPNLRVSPIGVVPQRDRRPRTIVDYSFSGINQETCLIAPSEAMQFGTALQRVIENIVNANPRFGPVQLCKVDIAEGFYRIEVRPADIPKLGVIIPSRTEDQEQLIAFPLVLPMGWKNSPPYFCAITETVADLTNERIRHHQQPPRHRLDRVADSHGIGEDDQQTCSAYARTPTTAVPAPAPALPASGPSKHPVNQPLGQFDIYVDDFLGMAQGNTRRLRRL